MKQNLILTFFLCAYFGSANAYENSTNSCTDFSGFWKGKCVNNLGPDDKSFLAIEQAADCSGLHYGPHPINFGVDNTSIWDNGNTTRVDNIDWNDPNNKNILVGDIQITRDNISTLTSSIRIEKMNPSKMRFTFIGTMVLANGYSLPFEQTCDYKKIGNINGDF